MDYLLEREKYLVSDGKIFTALKHLALISVNYFLEVIEINLTLIEVKVLQRYLHVYFG